jgi:hypothetical protein
MREDSEMSTSGEIPMWHPLNFMRFQDALSKKALEVYGTIGKIIKKGMIEEPTEPDRTDDDLMDKYDKVTYLEELKTD